MSILGTRGINLIMNESKKYLEFVSLQQLTYHVYFSSLPDWLHIQVSSEINKNLIRTH